MKKLLLLIPVIGVCVAGCGREGQFGTEGDTTTGTADGTIVTNGAPAGTPVAPPPQPPPPATP